MKYCRQTYLDLLSRAGFHQSVKEHSLIFVSCFKRIEPDFISERRSRLSDLALADMQTADCAISDEKISTSPFEKISDPFLFNAHSVQFKANNAVLRLIENPTAPGQAYYRPKSGASPRFFPGGCYHELLISNNCPRNV